MSVRPELTGIALALEYCPAEEDLAILSDSKASMDLLQSMQREDFPLWLYGHPARQLPGLVHIARLINQRAADGVATRLVQVKAHAGDPLNEVADTLTSDAAEVDPSQSQDVDPEGVHFGYRGALVPWNSRLRRELTQVAAAKWAAKCVGPLFAVARWHLGMCPSPPH
jgi:ribonuclease HI